MREVINVLFGLLSLNVTVFGTPITLGAIVLGTSLIAIACTALGMMLR